MTSPTIHFIYVKGDSIATPFAITNQLLPRLQKHFRVQIYDWLERTNIDPSPGDILLGHPHPSRKTVYARSHRHPNWGRKIVVCPYSHYDVLETAYLHPFVEDCDVFLAITGKYWIDTIAKSKFSHWEPKIIHLDLAVAPEQYPFVKEEIGELGKRRFLYIGNTHPHKGTDYLERIVDANCSLDFSWIGAGTFHSTRVKRLGQMDFSKAESKTLIAGFDFLIHTARNDANATTILEAASWGLIPVCTPQSGYYNENWIVNIPFGDVERASQTLQYLNTAPEEELRKIQINGRRAIAEVYTWDRFARIVLEAVCEKGIERSMKQDDDTEQNRKLLKTLSDKGARAHALHQMIHDTRTRLAQLRRQLFLSRS